MNHRKGINMKNRNVRLGFLLNEKVAVKIIFGFLGLLCLFSFIVDAKEPEWKLQDPIVITSADPPSEGRRNFLYIAPMKFCWGQDKPILVSLKGPKTENSSLEFWQEQQDRSWKKLTSLEKVGFPYIFDLGKDIGVIASVGKDADGGYGNAINFYRISQGKEQFFCEIAKPPSAQNRLTVCNYQVFGETISVFMLSETQGEKKNQLLFAQSGDGGKTWSKVQKIAETTMSDDYCRLPAFRWTKDHLGQFVFERDGKIIFYRTKDGGKSWKAEESNLSADIKEDGKKIPLGSVVMKDMIGVVYLVDSNGVGRYYFTQSNDEAQTWSKSVLITPELKSEDPSLFVQLASAGDRIAFSYIEVTGSWTAGEMKSKLVISEDHGKTWTNCHLDDFYKGVALFSALSGSPKGDRILFATAICINPENNPKNFLAVQEYSAQPLKTELTAEEKKKVDSLIADLGNDDWQTRDVATQKLATYGMNAKKILLETAKNTKDPEVQMRVNQILKTIFPECIKINIDK